MILILLIFLTTWELAFNLLGGVNKDLEEGERELNFFIVTIPRGERASGVVLFLWPINFKKSDQNVTISVKMQYPTLP